MSKDYTADFIAFWAAYPRHSGCSKWDAWLEYDKIITKGIATPAVILEGVRRYPFSQETKYQPHARTWLHQRRFEGDKADSTPATIEAVTPKPSRATWRDKYDGGGDPSMFFPATRRARMSASDPFAVTIEGGFDE
jgi:hypothetical protein